MRLTPTVPIPEHVPPDPYEPVPASPDYEDQRAGELPVGHIVVVTETRHRTPTDLKHLHKGPLGFSDRKEEE